MPVTTVAVGPIAFMLANNIIRHRWRLDTAESRQGYALLDELHAEGDVDYAVHIVKFGGSATTALQGVALTVCTDDRRGFAREELAFLNELVPPLALAAYRIALDGEEPPELDGLSGWQRFYVSWAQGWRGKGRDQEVIRRLALDPHSPEEFRCNAVVRNIDSFHQAFDVRPDDELWLAPEERVRIW